MSLAQGVPEVALERPGAGVVRAQRGGVPVDGASHRGDEEVEGLDEVGAPAAGVAGAVFALAERVRAGHAGLGGMAWVDGAGENR